MEEKSKSQVQGAAGTLGERYRIERELGAGGQATTYLARDERSGGLVALKELRFEDVTDWKAVELFEREAEALERLDHPSIPGYLDVVEHFDGDDLRIYLVQEFVEGDDLEEELASGARFDGAELRRFLTEMLEVLVYLQSFRPPVIHRDIKPSNIIRRSDGRFLLIDFGAVQLVESKTVGGSTFIGTAGYVPPEQSMSRAQPASDIYALGVTALQLMTGIAPHEMPTTRMRFDVRALVGERLAPELVRLLEKMVEPAVEDRFAEAREALEALRSPNGRSALVDGRLPSRSGSGLQRRGASSRELALDAPRPLALRAPAAEPWIGRLGARRSAGKLLLGRCVATGDESDSDEFTFRALALVVLFCVTVAHGVNTGEWWFSAITVVAGGFLTMSWYMSDTEHRSLADVELDGLELDHLLVLDPDGWEIRRTRSDRDEEIERDDGLEDLSGLEVSRSTPQSSGDSERSYEISNACGARLLTGLERREVNHALDVLGAYLRECERQVFVSFGRGIDEADVTESGRLRTRR